MTSRGEKITRRDFLKRQLSLGAVVSAAPFLLDAAAERTAGDEGVLRGVSGKEALYYEPVEG